MMHLPLSDMFNIGKYRIAVFPWSAMSIPATISASGSFSTMSDHLTHMSVAAVHDNFYHSMFSFLSTVLCKLNSEFLDAFCKSCLCSSSISQSGIRRGPTFIPIRFRAVLTGIGLTSQNSALISGSASSCNLAASAVSPQGSSLPCHESVSVQHWKVQK